jgi:hypothetical protein
MIAVRPVLPGSVRIPRRPGPPVLAGCAACMPAGATGDPCLLLSLERRAVVDGCFVVRGIGRARVGEATPVAGRPGPVIEPMEIAHVDVDVDVDVLVGDVQITHRLQRDRRERLVDLEQVHIGRGPALPPQRLEDRVGRLAQQRRVRARDNAVPPDLASRLCCGIRDRRLAPQAEAASALARPSTRRRRHPLYGTADDRRAVSSAVKRLPSAAHLGVPVKRPTAMPHRALADRGPGSTLDLLSPSRSRAEGGAARHRHAVL